ncbi:hypothetical protein [Streptomyces nigrescens]
MAASSRRTGSRLIPPASIAAYSGRRAAPEQPKAVSTPASFMIWTAT